MKKSCYGCKALINRKCSLKFRMEVSKSESKTNYIPLQQCPKPRTRNKLLSFQNEHKTVVQ